MKDMSLIEYLGTPIRQESATRGFYRQHSPNFGNVDGEIAADFCDPGRAQSKGGTLKWKSWRHVGSRVMRESRSSVSVGRPILGRLGSIMYRAKHPRSESQQAPC